MAILAIRQHSHTTLSPLFKPSLAEAGPTLRPLQTLYHPHCTFLLLPITSAHALVLTGETESASSRHVRTKHVATSRVKSLLGSTEASLSIPQGGRRPGGTEKILPPREQEQGCLSSLERSCCCSHEQLWGTGRDEDPFPLHAVCMQDTGCYISKPLVHGGRMEWTVVRLTCGEEVLSGLVWGALHAPRSSR